jgi:hypothetical protein
MPGYSKAIIERRITAVTAIRSKLTREVRGWLGKCYTCGLEAVYMKAEHNLAVDYALHHICRKRNPNER